MVRAPNLTTYNLPTYMYSRSPVPGRTPTLLTPTCTPSYSLLCWTLYLTPPLCCPTYVLALFVRRSKLRSNLLQTYKLLQSYSRPATNHHSFITPPYLQTYAPLTNKPTYEPTTILRTAPTRLTDLLLITPPVPSDRREPWDQLSDVGGQLQGVEASPVL